MGCLQSTESGRKRPHGGQSSRPIPGTGCESINDFGRRQSNGRKRPHGGQSTRPNTGVTGK